MGRKENGLNRIKNVPLSPVKVKKKVINYLLTRNESQRIMQIPRMLLESYFQRNYFD